MIKQRKEELKRCVCGCTKSSQGGPAEMVIFGQRPETSEGRVFGGKALAGRKSGEYQGTKSRTWISVEADGD